MHILLCSLECRKDEKIILLTWMGPQVLGFVWTVPLILKNEAVDSQCFCNGFCEWLHKLNFYSFIGLNLLACDILVLFIPTQIYCALLIVCSLVTVSLELKILLPLRGEWEFCFFPLPLMCAPYAFWKSIHLRQKKEINWWTQLVISFIVGIFCLIVSFYWNVNERQIWVPVTHPSFSF